MANKTTPESGQETKTGRTPEEEVIAERNRKKSKDYRERMKDYGYEPVSLWVPRDDSIKRKMREVGFRRTVVWEKRDQKEISTKIKVLAAIRRDSINVTKHYPEVRKALSRAIDEFCRGIESIEGFQFPDSLCEDFRELLKPLSDQQLETQTEQLSSKCGEGFEPSKTGQ